MIRYPRIQNIAPSERGYKKQKQRYSVWDIQQINKTDKTYISDLGLENYKMFKVYQTGTFPP